MAACSTPDNLDATVASPAAADGDDTTRAQIERAERTLADCKQRLARYRTALEAGTDPAVIAQWSAEVQAEQARRDQPATSATGIHTAAERDELQNLIREAGDLVPILANADATDRRGLYAALGLRLTYHPDRRRVVVECRPDGERLGKLPVGGAIATKRPRWCSAASWSCSSRRAAMGRPRLPLDEIEETPAVVDGDTRALTVLATDLSSRVVRMVGPQLDLTPTFRVRIESPRSVDAERPPLHGRGAEPDSPYCWSDWPFAATPTA